MKPWTLSVSLLLLVATLGCGEKPEPVAEEVERSSSEPEIGRDAAIDAIESWGGSYRCDDERTERSITTVDLSNTLVNDADLEHLKGMTSLRELKLGSTEVTDAGLEHLKGMTSLQSLDLRVNEITDAGLEHLEGLTSLHTLDLRETLVTDAGVNELKKALPNCEVSY